MKQHSPRPGFFLLSAVLIAPLAVAAIVAAAKVTQGAGKAAGEKFDPVKVNGKFFEGWPKPDLAILITGRQDGYLEPCGCAGLENQKGGVSRRHSLIKQLRQDGWPLLEIDTGGLVHRFGRQAEIKFAISADALKTMGYRAVGFGAGDLRLSGGEIAAVVGDNADTSMFVSANVDLFGLTPQVKIIDEAGFKIGITSVLGDEYQKTINNPDVVLKPAAESLKEAVEELKQHKLDRCILLANATLEESQDLAKKFPQFNIVVTADGGDEPPHRPAKVEGTETDPDRSRTQGHVRRGDRPLQTAKAAFPLPAGGARLAIRRHCGNEGPDDQLPGSAPGPGLVGIGAAGGAPSARAGAR